MAYFNHAFQKAFIGTAAFNVNAGGGGSTPPFNGTGSTSTSSGTTITVPSTTGLTVGMQVGATGGTGAFAPGTFVTNVISATQFTVNVPPVVALAASNVQGWYSSLSQPTGGFTFVDPNSLRAVVADNSAFNAHTLKCPLVLASGSVHGQWTGGKDKVGPFHGGYTESVKSKTINPRFVSSFYRVDSCPAQQAQVTVGLTTSTPIVLTGVTSSSTTVTVSSTAGILPGMTIAVVAGTGTLATTANANVVQTVTGATTFTILTAPTVALSAATISVSSALTATCPQDFLCGETYNLRVDLKGSPALRFLTRNSYYTAAAYTGCCPTGSLAPSAVNPLIVYVNWAYQLLNSPLIGNFIQVQVTYSTDLGVTFAALGDGTNSATNLALLQSYVLGNTALPVNATAANLTQAGIIINGAYADTRFQDCTFYPNDSIIAFLEPIQVYASEVDLNGDPCTFSGVCVNNSCKAVQQKGTGENIIRSVIMTQAYSQDPFYNGQDLRIREITNGTDVYGTINRTASYSRYYLQHSVPRFNNPTGTFDNEQYLLEIVAPATVSLTLSATLGVSATALVTSSNAINFTTSGVATGYVATITYTPPGATAGVITASTTVTVVSGTSISINVGTAIPAGSVITFQAAFTKNFEDFTNKWISNAQSPGSTACVQLEVYNCPVACAVIPANP